jgi:hypothetical protein
VSSQRGIAIAIAFFSHFADPVWLKIFSSGAFKSQSKRKSAAIVRHRAITASSHNSKKRHQFVRKSHATCIVRIADISFMENTFLFFEFRLMTV